jgi:DNA repair protein RadA/Sms
VLNFEGEKHTRLRLVRAIKNRFGATDEVGCFDLNENGIEGLADPTGLFLSRHSEPVPGTCITVAMEGRRPLLAEIQALVGGASNNTNPRRTTSGLDNARAMMTLAVLELRAGIPLAGRDTYLATVGGMKLTEPAADLALALAVGSAAKGFALPADLIALGEVGLAGDVRKVNGIQQRLNEAARLGFTRAIVPDLKGELKIPGMEILEVTRLTTALERVRLK